MKRVSLTVVGGVHAGRQIPLPVGNFLVGREQDCQLRPQSDLVSRHHCVFMIDEYGARLRDLGSTNGTSVNGERISTPAALKDGDRVVIGDLEFTVATLDAASPIEPPAAVEAAAALGQPDSVAGGADTILELAKGEINPGGETISEMPAFDASGTGDTETFATEDSTILEQPIQPPAPMPQQPMPMQQPMPQPYPPQYPYGQPGYPPMGYPQQPMPYPAMPYPQQPMAYPQQPYPQPMPQQPVDSVPEAVTQRAEDDVALPPPEETGAKEAAAKGSAGAGVNKDDPSTHAADIIKQMQTRRPGT